MEERAKQFYIVIDDVSTIHLSFTDEFLAAVEAKQVARQNAKRAKYLVEQAVQEKQSVIVKAEGEATSAELIEKYMNLHYIEFKRLETAKKIAEVLAKSENTVFIDTETLLLNIKDLLGYKLVNPTNKVKMIKEVPVFFW